jgi:hypothetical protein
MTSLKIPLTGKRAAGRVAIVDAGDYDLMSTHRWHVREKVRPAGNRWGPWAVTSARAEDGRLTTIAMHTMITGWALVDHVNTNGLDNRRVNLRPATIAQNRHNSRPNHGTSSHFKGVTWHKANGKWQAGIKIDGKNRYLGIFASEVEAARVYDAAALDAFGEFAYLNFPEVA